MHEYPPQHPHTAPVTPMVNRDTEHLKLLSIFWYVSAGLNSIGGCISLFYIGMGAIMLANPEAMASQSNTNPNAANQPPPEAIGWMFVGMGGCIMLLSLGMAALAFFTARGLSERRNRTFCMVVAGITCLSIPLGTILGVFTLMVLARPTVAEMFARNAMTRTA